MTYTYSTHHCMECDNVIPRVSITKCKKCGMEICKKCLRKGKGFCSWCIDEAPDEYRWMDKFATMLLFLSPVFGFLLPLPQPIIWLAIQSNLKLLIWGAVYTTVFIIIFSIIKSKSRKGLIRSTKSRTPSIVATRQSRDELLINFETASTGQDATLNEVEIKDAGAGGNNISNSISIITCTNCGSALEAGDDFCPDCGTPVHTITPAAPKTSRLYTEPSSPATVVSPRPSKEIFTPAVEPVKRCESCGEVIDENETFCPKCGADLIDEIPATPLKCSGCGKEITPEDLFCGFCGKPV
ncbi:MAG: double zinc ribbon domain-containing protein [Promethearchaeota archaeon]